MHILSPYIDIAQYKYDLQSGHVNKRNADGHVYFLQIHLFRLQLFHESLSVFHGFLH